MKRLILFPVLALVLSACQTTSTPSVSPIVTTVTGLLPQQVQDVAVKTCGFLPAAETVAQLVAAFGGPSIPGIATQIADEICAAVQKKSVRRSGGGISVRGVPVVGSFVR